VNKQKDFLKSAKKIKLTFLQTLALVIFIGISMVLLAMFFLMSI